MNLKDKILFVLIGMFFISAVVNIFLIKYRVQVNLIAGGGGVNGGSISSSGQETSVSQKTPKSFFSFKSTASKASDFYADFESGSNEGWKGKVTKEIITDNSKFSLLAPQCNSRYFATKATKAFNKGLLKVGPNTRLEFDYYIKDGSFIHIQSYNPTQRDNFYFKINNPELEKWTTASINFSDLKDNSHRGKRPQRNDEFSSIQIYGGKSGEDTLFVIDNFKIIDVQ